MTFTGRLLELRVTPWLLAVLAVPALAVVGVIDTAFDVSVRLTMLYLLPVAIASWVGGRGIGIAVALAAATTQFVVDLTIASDRWVLALWNFGADLVVYLGAAALLLTMRKGLAEAHSDARTDPLTGLRNVRAFRDAAEAEAARARRYGHPLSLALLDLDRFKLINDTQGHRVGDDVLRGVARHLEQSVRTSDVVARVGGDEFAVLMPETGKDAATAALRHLGTRAGKGNRAVDFSVGVVSYDDGPPDVDQMLGDADRAMYEQKHRRRHPS
ncbi:MAG TPA: diguanylate cyclase [Mycobacteriales bacterium]|jgi:diguanylate cyclase (GGDEF)-like protein|nr:diguanylate cyclase [Mycobacteriales bacterium]